MFMALQIEWPLWEAILASLGGTRYSTSKDLFNFCKKSIQFHSNLR